jgi:DNA mismatch endonuclease (patch repair protein)
MDVHTQDQRSRNMSAIRNKGTKMEILLGKSLWAEGFRYRKNYTGIIGKPDFVLVKYKIAIFVDSEFFHGKDWETNKERIGTNRDFWWKKIESNMQRDALVNKTLKKQGWKVIRFWSNDVKFNVYKCCEKIMNELKKKQNDN